MTVAAVPAATVVSAVSTYLLTGKTASYPGQPLGGADPATSSWLSSYFQAPVQPVTPPSPGATLPPVAPGASTDGFVVELGQDYHNRFYGVG